MEAMDASNGGVEALNGAVEGSDDEQAPDPDLDPHL